MVYNNFNPQDAGKKAAVVDAAVYLILGVSLWASLAYWYELSGGSYTIVLVGLAAEAVKKISISYLRNWFLWGFTTIVSILTVLGLFMVYDQNKQQTLTFASHSYQDARAAKVTAQEKAADYAFASSYNLDSLSQEKASIVEKRSVGENGRRGMSYAAYLAATKDIEQKIADRKAYDAASTTVAMESRGMESVSSDAKSNPLLSTAAKVFDINSGALTLIFYLLVTVLLEASAWTLGGFSIAMRRARQSTQEELLSLQVEEVYGVPLSGLVASFQAKTATTAPSPLHINSAPDTPTATTAKLSFGMIPEHRPEIKEQTPPSPTQSDAPRGTPQTVPNLVQSTWAGVTNWAQNTTKKEKNIRTQKKGVNTLEIKEGQERESADTSTVEPNNKRYLALKRAVIEGAVKPSIRGVRAFKFGDTGIGSKIAEKYIEALQEDRIISSDRKLIKTEGGL